MLSRSLLIFLFLFLLGAAVNVPVALETRPSQRQRMPTTVNVFGAEAAQRGWPSPPPVAWPAVTQWSQEEGEYGALRRIAWSAMDGRQATHQMQVDSAGWPMPAIRRVQLWWPWDDPKWQTEVPTDGGWELHWPGLIGNPLLFASFWWLLLVAPFVCFFWIRSSVRRRRRLCTGCAYPIGAGEVCTECGAPVQRRKGVTHQRAGAATASG